MSLAIGGTSNIEVFDCSFCNVPTQHNWIAPSATYSKEILKSSSKMHVYFEHAIYKCVCCNKDTYFLLRKPIYSAGGVIQMNGAIIHRYPIPTHTTHQSIPPDVKAATVEAEKCLSIGAPNACGVMARRAIHALCQDKGAKGDDDLYKQLKSLKENHQITPDLWEWAEELRVIGKSGAHPNWEEVSPEEADYAIKFLREIIRYVYINPHERDKRRVKETKKKKE